MTDVIMMTAACEVVPRRLSPIHFVYWLGHSEVMFAAGGAAPEAVFRRVYRVGVRAQRVSYFRPKRHRTSPSY